MENTFERCQELHRLSGKILEKFKIAKELNEQNKINLEKYNLEYASVKKQGQEIITKNELYTKAIKVLQRISDKRNSQAMREIETSIDSALSKVFIGEGYSIKINNVPHGKYNYSYITLVESNGKERSLAKGTGSGIRQIVSFLCNVLIIKFTGCSRILLTDELFNKLSPEYAIIMSDLLVALAETLDFQFIMIEHNHYLWTNQAVNVIRLKKTRNGLVLDETHSSITD